MHPVIGKEKSNGKSVTETRMDLDAGTDWKKSFSNVEWKEKNSTQKTIT